MFELKIPALEARNTAGDATFLSVAPPDMKVRS